MEGPTAHADHLGEHVALPGTVVGDADGPAEMTYAELGQHLRQRQELLPGGHVAGQPTPVLGTVLQVLVGGDAESASLHGIVKDLLHLVELVFGDRGALAGRDHTQHVAAQGEKGTRQPTLTPRPWRSRLSMYCGKVSQSQRIPLTHGLQGYGLNAVHHPHVEVAIIRAGGRKSEPALADG